MSYIGETEDGRSGRRESRIASTGSTLPAGADGAPRDASANTSSSTVADQPATLVNVSHELATPSTFAPDPPAGTPAAPAPVAAATASANGDPASSELPPLKVPLLVRHLDLVILGVALPVFVAASLPLGGYAVAAGAWILQRVAQALIDRRVRASADPRTVVGLLAASMISRAWLVAIAVFLVGLSDNSAGLAAAVLIVALFTVYFTTGMILRPLQAPARRPREASSRAVATGASHQASERVPR